jgi:uncharacterized membrane protein required for colicin V production
MTAFDALLLAIVAISVFFAAVRGAIREMATLAALAGAALAGYLLARPVAALFGAGESFLVAASVGLAFGTIGFLGFYYLLHKAMLRLKLSDRRRMLDRVAGGAFGLLRALALIGLGFLGYGYYLDEANQPDAVRNAALLPVAAAAADFFEQFAPANRELRSTAPEKNAAAEGYANRDRSGLKEIVTTVTTAEKGAGRATEDPIAAIITEETAGDDEPNQR